MMPMTETVGRDGIHEQELLGSAHLDSMMTLCHKKPAASDLKPNKRARYTNIEKGV